MGNPLSEGLGSDTGAATQATSMLSGNGGAPDGDFGGGQQGSEGTGQQYQGNPAHAEFFNVVPQEYHQAITPVLQKWDQGVTERFNKVQSDYAPWQEVIGSGNTPQDVALALNVLQTMLNNPREVYDALGAQYNFTVDTATGNVQQGTAGASGQGQNEPPDVQTAYDQRIAALENHIQRLAGTQLNYMQQAAEAAEDQALEDELNGLKKQYGDYDEDFVLAKMQAGHSGAEAVQMYQQFVGRLRQQGPQPLILGASGGAVPDVKFDPVKATDTEIKNIAVQMLQGMNRQGQ